MSRQKSVRRKNGRRKNVPVPLNMRQYPVEYMKLDNTF